MMKILQSASAIARAIAANGFAGLAIAAVAAVIYFSVPQPHQARAQFADQGAWATATSAMSGGATAVTLTLNNVSSLNDIVGVNISFNPPANSTGPVSIVVTGSAGTTASTALQRPSSIGLVALSLNELWSGETTSVKYNGSVFVLTSNVDMTPIGRTVEYRGFTTPRGTLIEDGSCVSQTTYAALFSVIGGSYGSCSAGLFALPDSRGTMFAALDGQGVNGLAGRITTASCTTPNTVNFCGGETKTLTLAQLPTGIVSNVPVSVTSTSTVIDGGPLNITVNTGSTNPIEAFFQTTVSRGTLASTGTATGTSNNTSGAAHPVLNPILLGHRAIKT